MAEFSATIDLVGEAFQLTTPHHQNLKVAPKGRPFILPQRTSVQQEPKHLSYHLAHRRPFHAQRKAMPFLRHSPHQSSISRQALLQRLPVKDLERQTRATGAGQAPLPTASFRAPEARGIDAEHSNRGAGSHSIH